VNKENNSSDSYQPESTRNYFDDLGMQEWERLVRTPADEVSLFIHTHYLEKYISEGDRVLEIGAGPGRFTQVLSRLGAKTLVADISNGQLELNRKMSRVHGFQESILDWKQMDICDLSSLDVDTFDCVVVYGGPFSYVLDKRDLALEQSLTVLKPGGFLFLSVMLLWGTAHGLLESILNLPISVNREIIRSGDITPHTFPGRQNNFMHMFRADECLDWLKKNGLKILDVSASNCLSLTWNETLTGIREDDEKWEELLQMELEACAQPGCLDMGTHLVVVARK
jgi:SAM-dependent methyltransferase